MKIARNSCYFYLRIVKYKNKNKKEEVVENEKITIWNK